MLVCVFVFLTVRCYLIFLLSHLGSGAPRVRTHLFPSDAAFGGRLFSLGCTASLACIHGPALGSLANWSPVVSVCGTVKAQRVCLLRICCRIRCRTWGVTWAGDSEIRETNKTVLARYDLQLYPQRTLQANCLNIRGQGKHGYPAP